LHTYAEAEIRKRASGRRRCNAARKRAKQYRQAQILCHVRWEDWHLWGIQAALARVLGVSRSTIYRDFAAIRDADHGGLLC
jgi:hypothetical protein